jgi:magnesium chelatase subunit D
MEPGDRIDEDGATAWARAVGVLALFAVDPAGLGGVVLRAAAGPARDAWLDALARLLPEGAPLRRVPARIDDERLLGGLELAATLRSGRAVLQRGVLAATDGGVLVLSMAERIEAGTAARLCAVIDRGEVRVERDGFAGVHPARFGVVALDEGADPDERLPAALDERLAFTVALDRVRLVVLTPPGFTAAEIAAARARCGDVQVDAPVLEALCATALALGVDSPRAALHALRATRAAAALAGRHVASAEDASLAAGLVLAPRATRLPAPAPAEGDADSATADAATEDARPAEPPPSVPEPDDAEAPAAAAGREPDLEDIVVAAARAAIPADLLLRLAALAGEGRGTRGGGRAGEFRQSSRRGRPAGVRAGLPRPGVRLALVDTLRAAAPWQALRRGAGGDAARIHVRSEDFHVRRHRERAETATVFVLDASGSSALHRLAEAKGAIELLLAQCYVRRDRVAVIAFRGRDARIVLPPTRSLVRARRGLAGLAGGGGTPLASALDAGAGLARSLRRAGLTPTLVLLTDGRANIALDGTADRGRAERDARAAARRLRGDGVRVLMVDTSPRGQAAARQLALDCGAAYLLLPYAGSAQLAVAVQRVADGARAAPGGA